MPVGAGQPGDVPARQVRRGRGSGAARRRQARRRPRRRRASRASSPRCCPYRPRGGRCGSSRVRTAPPSTSPRTASRSCSRQSGRSTTAPTAPASGWSARRRAGRATTAARPACTRRNIHDSAYPVGAHHASPAARRWWSGRTARASAASSCRRSWSGPTGGCSPSRARATPCASVRSTPPEAAAPTGAASAAGAALRRPSRSAAGRAGVAPDRVAPTAPARGHRASAAATTTCSSRPAAGARPAVRLRVHLLRRALKPTSRCRGRRPDRGRALAADRRRRATCCR